MGVSKVGREGVGDRPRMGGGLWFWAKEVLVGSGGLGVSRIFQENLPPQALPNPLHPFSPPRPLPPILPPSNTSLQLSSSGLYQPLLPSLPFFPPPTPFFHPQTFLRPLSDLLRTPSESLHRVPKRPFLGLFRGFPPKPPKGPKYPFLGPF